MVVGLVIPAHGRLAVSRLAFTGYAWLIGELAVRGITANAVVVADDENLDLAREFGFCALERPNVLGAKVNDGFQYAAELDADWICFTGSDNWLHPDIFDVLNAPHPTDPVFSGRRITVVDLERPRSRDLHVGSPVGAPPWLIPRWALEKSGFRPCLDEKTAGIEGQIVRGMGFRPRWVFHDPFLGRVDFKSASNLTGYGITRSLGVGDETTDPWKLLGERYPFELTSLAQQTAVDLATAAGVKTFASTTASLRRKYRAAA